MNQELAAEMLALALSGNEDGLRRLMGEGSAHTATACCIALCGVTPLMAAAEGGHDKLVQLLIECGADPARRDDHGRTAAHYARNGGHHCLAERLDTVVDKERTLW